MDWLDTGGFVGSGDLWVLGAWGRSASWADLLQGGWWWCDEPLLSTLIRRIGLRSGLAWRGEGDEERGGWRMGGLEGWKG